MLAVVIPAHNEERHVGGVLEAMPAFVDHVIVVDDGSTDGTVEEVLASTRPEVALIRRTSNGGMGAAIVDGLRTALGKGAELVAVMDADGQMDSSRLPELLDPIVEGRTDFSKGNRFFSSRSFEGMPAHRVFGNIVLTFLTKVATGYWHMFDSENGYTASSARTLRRLPLEKLETGYQFANRFLIELSAAGARVLDVPIPAHYGEETSGIRIIRDGLAIVRTLAGGFFVRAWREYMRKPSLAGVLLAVSLLALGVGLGGLVALPFGASTGLLGLTSLAAAALGLFVFLALDASRKRGVPAEGVVEVATIDLRSGPQQSPADERELARREGP